MWRSLWPSACCRCEYLLDLGVLLEIAWHVLRPVQTSLPPEAFGYSLQPVALALLGGILLA